MEKRKKWTYHKIKLIKSSTAHGAISVIKRNHHKMAVLHLQMFQRKSRWYTKQSTTSRSWHRNITTLILTSASKYSRLFRYYDFILINNIFPPSLIVIFFSLTISLFLINNDLFLVDIDFILVSNYFNFVNNIFYYHYCSECSPGTQHWFERRLKVITFSFFSGLEAFCFAIRYCLMYMRHFVLIIWI